MRLEKMDKDERKFFMKKFSYEELDTISKLIFSLNKDLNIENLSNLVLEIREEIKDFKKEKNIDIKYILKKFDYGELLTLNDLLEITNEKEYKEEKYYVENNMRNLELLAKQTQDFENLGYDMALYYWESISPQIRKWYSDVSESDNAEISPEELYVYCKKINDAKYGRSHQ